DRVVQHGIGRVLRLIDTGGGAKGGGINMYRPGVVVCTPPAPRQKRNGGARGAARLEEKIQTPRTPGPTQKGGPRDAAPPTPHPGPASAIPPTEAGAEPSPPASPSPAATPVAVPISMIERMVVETGCIGIAGDVDRPVADINGIAAQCAIGDSAARAHAGANV